MKWVKGEVNDGKFNYPREGTPQIARLSGKNHRLALGKERAVPQEAQTGGPFCWLAQKRNFRVDRKPSASG